MTCIPGIAFRIDKNIVNNEKWCAFFYIALLTKISMKINLCIYREQQSFGIDSFFPEEPNPERDERGEYGGVHESCLFF